MAGIPVFSEKRMIEKLKKRWGAKSNLQVFLILLVFAITGSTIVLIKRPVFELLGFDFAELSLPVKIVYYIFILPVYLGLLIIIGYLFGQGEFFMQFVRKFIKRFSGKKTGPRP